MAWHKIVLKTKTKLEEENEYCTTVAPFYSWKEISMQLNRCCSTLFSSIEAARFGISIFESTAYYNNIIILLYYYY